MALFKKPRALDLCCGAGGATKGLQYAGFHVTGVDINPQPHYCGDEFMQADALTVPFTFIWSSPPCQRYTPGAAKWGTQDNHPHMIPPMRARLVQSGVPWLIENVSAARKHLIDPVMLCGTQFNLGVFRHRLFEASFTITVPPHTIHVGSIGDGKYHTVTGHAGGSSKRDGWKNGGVAEWRIAMGIDWMTGDELAEAIPPAYSRFIGHYARQVMPLVNVLQYHQWSETWHTQSCPV